MRAAGATSASTTACPLGSARTETAALAAGRRLLGGRVLLDGPLAGHDVPHTLVFREHIGPTSLFLESHDAEVGETSLARAFGMKAACSRSTRSSAFMQRLFAAHCSAAELR